MKRGLAVAALTALSAGVSAARHGPGHQHLFAKRNATAQYCLPACTTIWTTITGEATLVPATMTTATAISTNTTTVTVQTATPSVELSVSQVPVPTPQSKVLPTPGTYNMPASNVTLSQTTTVCAATSTKVPAGTHVVGGVTTIVATATTVTCPVATVITSGSVITSTIVQTTYVCPSAGTYTIALMTTTVSHATEIAYPVPTSYSPGTYVAPQKVVTVTETGFVYVCPFTSSGLPSTTPSLAPHRPSTAVVPPAAASSHETPAASAPTSTTHEAVPLVPTKSVIPLIPTSAVVSVLPPQKQSPSPYPKPSPAPIHASPGGLSSNNDHFGITYTPYVSTSGQCKSAGQVDEDIGKIKAGGFTTVRVYSTDCDTLENVGSACKKHGVNMIVGLFVKAGDGCSLKSPEIQKQMKALASWDKWDMVKLVVVGNEAIMNYCSPSQLRDLVIAVKSTCPQYHGPYTIAETLNVWQRPDVATALCGVVDVTGANIHPYFNHETPAHMAGKFMANQFDLLSKVCSGNEVINLECGWPSHGDCNGLACPGKSEQAAAIRSISKEKGSNTVFFSFEDDMWKPAGSCKCEQSWGMSMAFASM